MSIAHSRVTAQGQISVPAEIRRRLGLSPGSIVEWDSHGELIVVRRGGRHTSEELHGTLFPEEPEARPLEEFKEGIRRRMRANNARR